MLTRMCIVNNMGILKLDKANLVIGIFTGLYQRIHTLIIAEEWI